MKRKCAVKTAGSLLLAGALAFAPQGSFLGNMQGIKAVQAEETDDWAIYWYLCGSDLESNYGSATEDLSELMEAELPENVKIVIETGGSSQWQNETVEADYLERYVYSSEGFECVQQLDSANMGESSTLADFLEFCRDNYPAEHTAVIFWNHGGGSAGGVAFDELYGYDSLSLAEIYDAFDSVYELSEENPPLELVGFDACLMATVDTANAFSDIARYMVASEETERGNGWYYTGWVQALADNPQMDGAELGTVICDTYMEGCEMYGTEDETTLSVVDLGKIGAVLTAYDNMGKEALSYACEDPSFFSCFGRNAEYAENYGGNTKDTGYTNMVDLRDLAENNRDILTDTCEDVIAALEDCVVYKVNGSYRQQAGGLSCYYSYDGNLSDFNIYSEIGASESFKYLYGYALSGSLSEAGQQYVEEMGYDEVPEIATLETAEDSDYPVYVNDDGYGVMELSMDTVNMLKGVYCQLAYFDEEEDILLYLGRDNDINMDWENGVFTDNFRGVWGAIDGYLVYMDIIYEGEDYNLYSVPILLNGEEYQLHVVYDYNEEDFQILGARKGLDDNGMSDRNLVKLKPGDEITTLHYGGTLSGDDELELVEVDTFTVTEDTAFGEEDLGDGTFAMMFELVDARNESATSDVILFTVEDGEIQAEA